MKRLMLLAMSGLSISCLTSVYAMKRGSQDVLRENSGEKPAKKRTQQPEIQPEKHVLLQAGDNVTQIFIPKNMAELSITLKNMFEDIEQGEDSLPIPLPNIDGPMLEALGGIMMAFAANSTMPEITKVQLIKQKISGPVTYEALIWAINYLDIELLKGPVANAMVKDLHKKNNGDREQIEATILSLNLPEEFAGLLAKYWYLNYGNGTDFILPDLDYGFSIEELRVHNKLPGAATFHLVICTLDLSGLRINDLSGLRNIPGINNVQILTLSDKQLTNLGPDVFNGLNNLSVLILSPNHFTNLVPGIFNGLNNLQALYLNNKQLTNLIPGVFNGLNNLKELHLNNNQLTNLVPSTFNGLNNLKELHLNNNQLINLAPGTFNGLNALQSLYLYSNRLTNLTPGAFDGLHNLQRFYLNGNQLTNFGPGVFNGLNKLQVLWLLKNKLTEAQKEVLRKQLPATVRIDF